MVQKSFKVWSISNALDGTGYDALCAKEMEGIPEARDDEAQDEIANEFKTDSEEED